MDNVDLSSVIHEVADKLRVDREHVQEEVAKLEIMGSMAEEFALLLWQVELTIQKKRDEFMALKEKRLKLLEEHFKISHIISWIDPLHDMAGAKLDQLQASRKLMLKRYATSNTSGETTDLNPIVKAMTDEEIDAKSLRLIKRQHARKIWQLEERIRKSSET